MLATLKIRSREIRSTKDVSEVDALIIPGGESTTIMKLLTASGLDTAITQRVAEGMPVLGTCAGAIVLSDSHLNLLDITVDRNAYGSQLQSFSDTIDIDGIGSIEAVFIRAPMISRVGVGVRVLASHEQHPVLVQKGNILVATFHPEVSHEAALHHYFFS